MSENYSPDKKYPIIYMTDGGTQNFEVAKGYINALSQTSFNIIPPSILVGIVHKERNEELYNVYSGKNFTQYLLNEVIPFIDSTYSSSGFNAMIGHSNGAEYNHILMLNKENPIRGFISLSTSFITSEKSREELPDFFKNYEGKNMYYFIGNATLDSPDRVEYGNDFESLYQNTPNTFIKFVKQTYEADHTTIVPHALLDGLKFVYQDYRNMNAYPTIVDYSEKYLENLEQNYGIEGSYSFLDLQGYFGDIVSNKKRDEFEYLLAFIKEYKLWDNGGFDPVNIANLYFVMEMYPEAIASYNKGLEELGTFDPMLFYANLSQAIESYKVEGKITEGIAFLERGREELSNEYYFGMTYHIAKLSLENNTDIQKGKEALEFCKANYTENREFTMDDLVILEKQS